MGCHPATQPVKPRILHPGIGEVHHVHDLVQGDVGVVAAQANQARSQEATKRRQRLAAKRSKSYVEPHHIRLQLIDRAEQASWVSESVEGPAANHMETI